MQKRGELSRLTINLSIGFLILCLALIIFIIVRGYVNEQDKYEVYTDEKIDLKISQVKKVDDNTLDLTLKRNTGEGNFIGLSFSVTDGNKVEVVRIDSSMPENETGNFSLKFIELNASNIKKISVTPIYLDKEGEEVVGNVKDEYITPNVCSTYCPPNAQCGTNGCGAPCGNGCAKGYLCLDYKCVKDKTSSSGGSSGGSSDSDDNCKDTCSSLGYKCGEHAICGEKRNCGTCLEGYTCQTNGTCTKDCVPATCQSLGNPCGIVSDGCGKTLNCINCSEGFDCQTNGTCTLKPCTDTCSSLGYVCGNMSVCGELRNCGNCSAGYSCANNGTCIKTCVPETDAQLCLNNNKQCGSLTVTDSCGVRRTVSNCGSCNDDNACTADSCGANGLCINTPILGCCLNSAQCGSGTLCPQDYCNLTDNKCYQNYPTCKHNDGCCPPGCNLGNDNDCTRCTSNSQCEDNNPCTINLCSNNVCTFPRITTCNHNDGCCPLGCNSNNDNDCSPTCGNGVIERGEQCDGSALGGATCASVLGTGHVGTLSCLSPPNGCLFDTSKCCKPETDAQFCSRFGRVCGNLTANDNCGVRRAVLNCGTCQSPLICAPNGTCVRSCVPTTCQALGRNCGKVSDGCGGTLTCGNYGGGCQSGYSCQANGTCMKDDGTMKYLVQNKVGNADIVVASNAPNTVKLASKYFQMYIYNMTGVTLPISSSPSTSKQYHVYIGKSTYTDNLGINSLGCRDGGFKIISGDNYLVLIGDDKEQTFSGPSKPQSMAAWDQLVKNKWGKNYLWENDYLGFYSISYHDSYDIWESDAKGTINAVYEFLYDQGIRWYHPGWFTSPSLGTIIPQKQDISFSSINKLVNPDFSLRSMILYSRAYAHIGTYHYDGRAEEEMQWRLSLRTNSYYEFIAAATGGPAHGLWALTTRQVTTHPEYYAMSSSGTRLIPGTVDYSNQDLCYPYDINKNGRRDEYVAYLKSVYPEFNNANYLSRYISNENNLFEEAVRYAKTVFDIYDVPAVSMMPNDGFGTMSYQCETSNRTFSDYVWEFVNNVAWEIYNDPQYAGKRIKNSVYPPYDEIPTHLSKPIAPNLEISISHLKIYSTDPESKSNFRNSVNSWINLLASNNYLTGGVETNEMTTGDAYQQNRVGSDTQAIPIVVPHSIQEDLQFLKGKSKGDCIEQWTSQAWPPYNQATKKWDLEWDMFSANAINTYVTARLYWDANLNLDELLNEYYTLFYGPARNEMKAFFEYSEANVDRAFVNQEIIPTMKNMLINARNAAGNNIYGQRIDLLLNMMKSQPLGEDIFINSCQDLTMPIVTYKLTRDISSTGTCFNFENFGITLDCQGHTINYTPSREGQSGIKSWYENGVTIKNCNIIQQKSYSPENSESVIEIYSGIGIKIENSNITTPGNGIWLVDDENIRVINNRVTSSSEVPLATQSVDGGIISNNILTSSSDRGMYLYSTDNMEITWNNVSSTSGDYAVVLMYSNRNHMTDNRFIRNGGSGLWEYLCSGNVKLRNTISS